MQDQCSICNGQIGVDPNGWSGGHNAQPVNNGRCCSTCNDTVVTSARLKDLGYSGSQISNIMEALKSIA